MKRPTWKRPGYTVSSFATVWPLEGVKIVKKRVLQSLTPPSDHINEYFEKKSGQPEWTWRILQSWSEKFFDSPYRLGSLYGEFSESRPKLSAKFTKSKHIFPFLRGCSPKMGGLGTSRHKFICDHERSSKRPLDRQNRASIAAARGCLSRHFSIFGAL